MLGSSTTVFFLSSDVGFLSAVIMAGGGHHLAVSQETLASLIPSEMEMGNIPPRHLDPDSPGGPAQHTHHQGSQTEGVNVETLNQQSGRPNEQQSKDLQVSALVPSLVAASNTSGTRYSHGNVPEFETLSCKFYRI